MLNSDKYDKNKSVIAQDEYCEQNDKPHFAPYTGTCYRCHRNIYKPQGWRAEDYGSVPVPFYSDQADYITGITTEEAGRKLVTGCPHCHMTFCD